MNQTTTLKVVLESYLETFNNNFDSINKANKESVKEMKESIMHMFPNVELQSIDKVKELEAKILDIEQVSANKENKLNAEINNLKMKLRRLENNNKELEIKNKELITSVRLAKNTKNIDEMLNEFWVILRNDPPSRCSLGFQRVIGRLYSDRRIIVNTIRKEYPELYNKYMN